MPSSEPNSKNWHLRRLGRWIMLVSVALLIYKLSPMCQPRLLIHTDPALGPKWFLVQTQVLHHWELHRLVGGYGLDSTLVAANTPYRLPAPPLMQRLFVFQGFSVVHPEFRDAHQDVEHFWGQTIQISPRPWGPILDKNPEIEPPGGVVPRWALPVDYEAKIRDGQIINLDQVLNHLISIRTDYLRHATRENKIDAMRGSLPVLRQLAMTAETANRRGDLDYDIGQDVLRKIRDSYSAIETSLR